MKIFMDDGSTNIKMLWNDKDGSERRHISPNSFKRGWSASFGTGKVYNYVLDGEKYSHDLISPSALETNNVSWQYSPLNVIAVHHALQTSGIEPQAVEIVVTLPLAEFFDADAQPNMDNIARKKESLMRAVELNKEDAFTIEKVTVRPESIPAGVGLSDELSTSHSMLIVDLGGTTLDVSLVVGKMTGISRVYGNSELGVSLVTSAVKLALANAETKTSSFNVDNLIINRNNDAYLADNINDVEALGDVKKAMEAAISRLQRRVLDVVNDFDGYTHIMVIGGGAPLIAEAIRENTHIREDRFFVSDDPQFDLVNGLKVIG
jgi:plasmid segregation protein ParM